MDCLGIFDDMVNALDFDEKADQRVITNLAQNLLSVSSLSLRFSCKSPQKIVEPRGFEPLTSAVQRRLLYQLSYASAGTRFEE